MWVYCDKCATEPRDFVNYELTRFDCYVIMRVGIFFIFLCYDIADYYDLSEKLLAFFLMNDRICFFLCDFCVRHCYL